MTYLNKTYKTVMSFNKPQKHVMSADRLAFTSLINSSLDLVNKKVTDT